MNLKCDFYDLNLYKNTIKMYNCDYKELIKKMIEDKIQVDLILTDPPYCVSRTNQLGFSNMGRSGMNYGEWDYNFNQTEWIELSIPILKKNGSIIIFNDWKNLSYIVEILEKNNCKIKDLLRWEKSNPMPRNVNSRYVSDFELAIWAVNGNKWTFNKPAEIPYIKPFFRDGVVIGNKRIHPTQKSLKIIEEIIKIHSNENEIIFDPFFGSGTMALACKNLNRKFIGSEIDENYYNKALKRLCL